MPKEAISTREAPEFPGYSQAVKAGNTIYVAGTIGVDVTTSELAGRHGQGADPPVAATVSLGEVTPPGVGWPGRCQTGFPAGKPGPWQARQRDGR